MANAKRRPLSLVHRHRGPTVVAAGLAARPPLLLLLHGLGSNELAMATLADAFDPRFIVLSVRGPLALGPFAYAWLHVRFTTDGPVIDGDEAVQSWTRLARFIDEAVQAYEADETKVFMVGFSQGGILVLATLLTAPEKVAGVVCMSGRLPPEVLPHVAAPELLRDKSVLIVHGRRDETLPIAYGRSALETLKRLPITLDYREFEMGHTTSPESIAAVAGWLSAHLSG